jgi:hypothetical protein
MLRAGAKVRGLLRQESLTAFSRTDRTVPDYGISTGNLLGRWPAGKDSAALAGRTTLQCSRSAAQGSSEAELAGPFEFPALPSVVSRAADDEQYHGARCWPENQQAS